jgi:hypothetical protein
MIKASDPWSIVTIVLTVVLFGLALFLQGLTHDILLEAGVFLVSAKLILMAKRNAETEDRLEQRLIRIEELLSRKERHGEPLKEQER